MKVNIITIHKEPNYGALLQAYALYHVLESLGAKPRIIDLSMIYRRRSYNLLNRLLITGHNFVKGYHICYAKAEEFAAKHEVCRTPEFQTLSQLKEFEWDKDDIYIVGSDQVWNPELTANLAQAFTFSFLNADYNKYSYASSFGNIKDEKRRSEQLDVEHTLKTFKRISVRESFGVDYLQRQNISAIEVIDPTLLVDDYSNLIDKQIVPSGNLLFLSLGTSVDMDRFVESAANKIGLNIEKHFGYLQPQRSVNKRFLSVEDWLWRIACSRVVITDSFHATVFSIIFEKPFYVYISNPSKSYRITNLLEKLGLSDRIVSNLDQVNIDAKIDYFAVKNKLKAYRIESLNYIKEILRES